MTLFIKNMVCNRCVLVVREQLDQLDMRYTSVQLGEVELVENPGEKQMQDLQNRLNGLGFEVLDDRRAAIVNKIKSTLIQLIHGGEAGEMNKKISVILAEKLHMDYPFLSGLFSSTEGVTIEKYIILQRIERAKELIVYDEMTLNEIADQLGYSSVQHLSQQFKKITGLTPSAFKQLKEKNRKPLDQV